ncbi:MAG TPA: tetratricopeptide repeat protein, partial [Polyangiaceae bacterium]|nr:tetratricopeptide repeat protein [Polyangiaceae bacterium]
MALCSALLAGDFAASAQTSDDEYARRHFESGAAYLQQSNYDDALREFQAAYSLSKRPQLLLNIANVYERLGKLREAIDALTQYLGDDPKSVDRTTIETRIANLKKRLDTAPPVASASPVPTADRAAPPSSAASTASPAPSPATPRHPANRAPAYIGFGVGGAAAIGAVVTGLLANGKFHDAETSCKPNCPDD